MESKVFEDVMIHFFSNEEARNGRVILDGNLKHVSDGDEEQKITFDSITLIQRISYEREQDDKIIEGEGIVVQTESDDYILTSSSADVPDMRSKIDQERTASL